MNPDIQKPSNLLDLRNPVKKQLPRKKKKLPWKRVFIGAVLLVLVSAGALLAYRSIKKENLDSAAVIKSKLSKHIILPKDEEPALATITDTSKLTTPFLKQSLNGDKLLVYQNAKKVIIYRPSIDRIIDVGPVSIAGPEGQ